MITQEKIVQLFDLYKANSLSLDNQIDFEKHKKKIYKTLAKDKNTDIRVFIAEDLNTPIEILTVLANDDAKRVIRAVAKNRSTPMNILENLTKHYDDSIIEEAQKNIENRKQDLPNNQKNIITPKEQIILKLVDLYKTNSLKESNIIEFEKYKKEIFEILAKDKNVDVRVFVAEDLNTPIEILTVLANDDAKRVIRAVAKNRSTPMNILEKLTKHYDDSVAEEAQKNIENKKKESLNPQKNDIEEIPNNIEENINSLILENYKQYLSKAIEHYNYKDYDEAINILNEGVKHYNHPFLFAYIAESYRKKNDLKNCEYYYSKIENELLTTEDKYIGEPFDNYASFLYENSQFEKAEKIMQIAIEISPQDINFLINYANILIKLNKIDEMISVLVNIYNLDSEKEKEHYLFSKYRDDFYKKLSKDARFGYINGIIIPLNSYCDLINVAIHLKIIYIDSNGFILIMKDINSNEEKDFIKSDSLLKLYLNNPKKYIEITKQIIKGISAKIHFILEQYDDSNLKIIENYLVNYKYYPIIPPSVLKYVIETMEHFSIDLYKISFLKDKVEENKKNYQKYKINNPKLFFFSMQDFYNKFFTP